MDRAEFLAEWKAMSFEERAAFVKLLIEEDCIDHEVPIPLIQLSPDGIILSQRDANNVERDTFAYGQTLHREGEEERIGVYGGSLGEYKKDSPWDVPNFDNPWEAVANAFHESSHWFRSFDGSSPADVASEELAESYAQVRVRNMQAALDEFNAAPGWNIWPLPIE
jgi:hypothetical protein